MGLEHAVFSTVGGSDARSRAIEGMKRAQALFGTRCRCGHGTIEHVISDGDDKHMVGHCRACFRRAQTAAPARGQTRRELDAVVRSLPCALCGREGAKVQAVRGAVNVCKVCCITHGGDMKALDKAERTAFEDNWRRGR